MRQVKRLSLISKAPGTDLDFILPSPYSLLPQSPSLQRAPELASPGPPMTAKRAAKAAKKVAKAKISLDLPTPLIAASTLIAPRLPYLYGPNDLDRFHPQSVHSICEPGSIRYSSHLSTAISVPFSISKFGYSCCSKRFQRELHALHIQKQQLLTLLRVQRKESLLQQKQELQEEKERLSRILAEDLAAGPRLKGEKSRRSVSKTIANSNLGPPSQPPSRALPAPPDTTLVPPSQVENLPMSPAMEALSTPSISNKIPLKRGKKKRSAYANANNAHHRQNYVPSRLPSSSAPRHVESQNGPPLTSVKHGFSNPLTTHAKKSAVFNFESEEWMCMFCEYELWYGSKPQIAQCVKNRKKVLKIRQKALDRAKGAIEGTGKKKSALPPPNSEAKTPDGKVNSKAALPGTIEQAQKAERAKPTPAPPPTPESDSKSLSRLASQAVPAQEVAEALGSGGARTSAVHPVNVISQVALLSCAYKFHSDRVRCTD